LGEIIRWYKGRCSFEIRKNQRDWFSWQRNYYEHIIRDNKSWQKIQDYIILNLKNWEKDENFMVL
jgi:REP element-mobilizing transposase RayT